MLVKSFVFRPKGDWYDKKLDWQKGDWYDKNLFLPFLTQPGPTFCPQNAKLRNSLNRISVRKDRNHIITNFMTLRLTN